MSIGDGTMTHTESVLDRLRTEAKLAQNGNHPILARSFNSAIDEIERMRGLARSALSLGAGVIDPVARDYFRKIINS